MRVDDDVYRRDKMILSYQRARVFSLSSMKSENLIDSKLLTITSNLNMPLKDLDGAVLPATMDCHVHLRDGDMLQAVAPTIRAGGVNTVFVMASEEI
jgi:dihydroorotase-like cyclic amidohydrolase